MRIAGLFIFSMALCGECHADEATVEVASVSEAMPYASVLMTVRNNSGHTLKSVRLSCGVFDEKKRLIGEADTYVDNVMASEKAYKRLLVSVSINSIPDALSAACRVIDAQ